MPGSSVSRHTLSMSTTCPPLHAFPQTPELHPPWKPDSPGTGALASGSGAAFGLQLVLQTTS
eukprot:3006255-Amphidinium_carterae.1